MSDILGGLSSFSEKPVLRAIGLDLQTLGRQRSPTRVARRRARKKKLSVRGIERGRRTSRSHLLPARIS